RPVGTDLTLERARRTPDVLTVVRDPDGAVVGRRVRNEVVVVAVGRTERLDAVRFLLVDPEHQTVAALDRVAVLLDRLGQGVDVGRGDRGRPRGEVVAVRPAER